jgi:hypothetical protein
MSLKISVTIQPATFWFVPQFVNKLRHFLSR